MLPRERVLTALSRRKPDKTPKYAWWTPTTLKTFKEKTGADDPAEYFGCEIQEVLVNLTQEPDRLRKYLPADIPFDYLPFHKYLAAYFTAEEAAKLPNKPRMDEWGTGHIPGSMLHFTKMVYPIKSFTSIKELEEYPFPEIVEDDSLPAKVARLKKEGHYVEGNIAQFVFETAWYLRGMDELLMDFMVNKEFASVLLDKVMEIKLEMAIRLARAGVDQLNMGDDVGMQDTMIMSPDTWREWLKPYLKRLIEGVKQINPDIHIFYHSDGWIEPIIPDMIEVGIDVLNPVQPECMDPGKIKQQYGDKLSFWGTVGTQTTMVTGSTADVSREVKERIETVGRDGGLVIAPANCISSDMPWENILAFFEAVEKYA